MSRKPDVGPLNFNQVIVLRLKFLLWQVDSDWHEARAVTSASEPVALDAALLEQIFAHYLTRVPVALALRSTMRMVALVKRLAGPESDGCSILDVGCGDGSFWHVFPNRNRLVVDGIDLSWHESNLARRAGVFRNLVVGDISKTAPEHQYDIALGNCSLEHVPDIHTALLNIRGALKPEGRLIMFVPAFGWARSLPAVAQVQRFSTRLAMAASGALDGFFQHHHIYDARSWTLLVEGAGYRILKVEALGSEVVNRTFQDRLPAAFFEFLFKTLARSYPSFLKLLRRRVSSEVILELLKQPVSIDAPGLAEYVLEAEPINH